MSPDDLQTLLRTSTSVLASAADRDWSVPAGALEWSCRTTVDHVVDCVFSYALQLAAGAPSGYLPFTELHALDTAQPSDLVDGLRAVGAIFLAVVRSAPDGTASDGAVVMGTDDWCARAAYEIALHTFDVASGLGLAFEPPGEVCASILASPTLWMLDRDRAASGSNPWTSLLLGGGRQAD